MMALDTYLLVLCILTFLPGSYSQQMTPESTARLLQKIKNLRNLQTLTATQPQAQAIVQNVSAPAAGNIDQPIQQAPASADVAQQASFLKLMQQLQALKPIKSLPTQQQPTSNSVGSPLQSMLPLAASGMATPAATSALTQGRQSPLGTLMASNVDVSNAGRGMMLMDSLQQQQQQQQQIGATHTQAAQQQQQQSGLFNGNPMNNYLTARAFDMGDTTSNMMLLGGMGQQTPLVQQQQMKAQLRLPGQQMKFQQQQSPMNMFGNSPMGGYMTARAFDMGDFASNMMLFNGMQQQTPQQQLMNGQQYQQQPQLYQQQPQLYQQQPQLYQQQSQIYQRQPQLYQQQQMYQQQQPQSSFDPMLALLWAM